MLFTPRNKDGTRLRMNIKETEIPRGKVAKFVVEEIGTGRKYKCTSAACGLPGCICDAVILEEIKEKKVKKK